ncbi:MAG: DUF4340 domain-containing protein [Eubacterium sp.]|nr:DUF4340 domain-containing protein [Eubacterium sp.]
MRRQKSKMIILALVLVILTAAVLFLKMPARSGQEDMDIQTAEDRTDRKLIEAGSVTEIEVVTATNGEENYTVKVQDGVGAILDFPEGRLDGAQLEDALERLAQTEVTEELGEQEDLLQFGLGEDAAAFKVVCTDGTTQEFRVGDRLAGRLDARYVLLDGKVCVAEGFPQELCEGRRSFYQLELIAVAPRMDENGENMDCLEYLRLSGSRFEEEIYVVSDTGTNSGYRMEEPVYGEAMFADTDPTTQNVSILDSLAYVKAASMAYENADADRMKECGLEEPYAVAEYSLNGEEHGIRVSAAQDGMRYLMVDEDPAVYRVEDIRVTAWAEAKASDLRTSYIWLVDVARLDTLVLTGENGRREYRIVENPEDNDQSFRVYCGEKELDTQEIWLPFYQKLLGMTILGTEEPSGWEEEPAYTVTYIYEEQEEEEPVTIEFHREYAKERYVALLNGRFAGTLRADTVEEAMELADKVSADGESR